MNPRISATRNTGLSSPLPGTVVRIFAREGDVVKKGDRLLVIETMKMMHELHAPRNGVVGNIHVHIGDRVSAEYQVAKLL